MTNCYTYPVSVITRWCEDFINVDETMFVHFCLFATVDATAGPASPAPVAAGLGNFVVTFHSYVHLQM